MLLVVWSAFELSTVCVSLLSCYLSNADSPRFPFAYRLDRHLSLGTSFSSVDGLAPIIICLLPGGKEEENVNGVHTGGHLVRTHESASGMYGRQAWRGSGKWNYGTQSFPVHIRPEYSDVGRHQCCQETLWGAREEPALWASLEFPWAKQCRARWSNQIQDQIDSFLWLDPNKLSLQYYSWCCIGLSYEYIIDIPESSEFASVVWRKQKNIVSWIVGPNEGEWSGLITVNQRHAGIESLTVPRGKTSRWKDLCVVETSWAAEKEKEKENVWTICTHASWVEFLQSSEREIEKPGFFTFSVCRERSALRPW